MAARETSQPLLICQRLLDSIRRHANENPELWFAVPLTWDTEPLLRHLEGPFPVVVVNAEEAEQVDQDMSDGGVVEFENIKITVHGLVSGQRPRDSAYELMSDIRRAVASDRQLVVNGEPSIPSGYLHYRGWKVATAPSDAGTRGECMVNFECEYNWDAGSS